MNILIQKVFFFVSLIKRAELASVCNLFIFSADDVHLIDPLKMRDDECVGCFISSLELVSSRGFANDGSKQTEYT